MATPEQRKQKCDEAAKKLQQITAIDPRTLARTEDLSRDINFADALPYFQQVFDVMKQLRDRDISRLSAQMLDSINSACARVLDLINKVNQFTLNQNQPANVCKSIKTEIINSYDEVIDPLIVPLAFTATQATDYAKIEREAKGCHSTMMEQSANFMEDLKKIRDDANKALTAVQEQAAQAGVSTNAQIYLQTAKTHSDNAQRWLIATIVISAATFLAAVVFLYISFSYKPATTAEAVQYVVSKIILLSTLSFGIFWCARNYKARKHNETLNYHRANALMTFRAFVEGTTDDRVKDAILLHAAHAAFAPRPTGFDSPDKEALAINPVVEVLGKSITKT
jgi:hypothetical protein